MKKILITFITCFLSLNLAGCSSNGSSSKKESLEMSEGQIEKIEKTLKDNNVIEGSDAGDGVYYSEKPFQYTLSPTFENVIYYELIYNMEKDIFYLRDYTNYEGLGLCYNIDTKKVLDIRTLTYDEEDYQDDFNIETCEDFLDYTVELSGVSLDDLKAFMKSKLAIKRLKFKKTTDEEIIARETINKKMIPNNIKASAISVDSENYKKAQLEKENDDYETITTITYDTEKNLFYLTDHDYCKENSVYYNIDTQKFINSDTLDPSNYNDQMAITNCKRLLKNITDTLEISTDELKNYFEVTLETINSDR